MAPDSCPLDVSTHLAQRERGQRDKAPNNEATRSGRVWSMLLSPENRATLTPDCQGTSTFPTRDHRRFRSVFWVSRSVVGSMQTTKGNGIHLSPHTNNLTLTWSTAGTQLTPRRSNQHHQAGPASPAPFLTQLTHSFPNML